MSPEPMAVYPMARCLDGRHPPFNIEDHPEGCPRHATHPTAHDREEAVKALTPLHEQPYRPEPEDILDYLDANPTARAALARYLATGEGLRERLIERLLWCGADHDRDIDVVLSPRVGS